MGAFNDLGRGKIGIGIEKVLGIGVAGALRSLSPEISTVVQLPISQEELLPVTGWARWASGFHVPAVGGQGARIKFHNPVGSGVIGVLEAAYFSSGLGGLWMADAGYANVSNLATIPNVDFRDGRTSPRAGGACIPSFTTQVGTFAATIWAAHQPAGVTVPFTSGPLVFLPGNAIDWVTDAVNSVVSCTLVWRERGATAAERALL